MSEKENSKTVFVKRGDKLWYLRTKQGQEYFDALENVFFQGGHGLFLSAQTRDLLYSFRTMTRRVLDKQNEKSIIFYFLNDAVNVNESQEKSHRALLVDK